MTNLHCEYSWCKKSKTNKSKRMNKIVNKKGRLILPNNQFKIKTAKKK